MKTATVTSRLWRCLSLSSQPPTSFCLVHHQIIFFLMIWLDAPILEKPLWERRASDSSLLLGIKRTSKVFSELSISNGQQSVRMSRPPLCECECVLFKESGFRLPPSCVLCAPVKDFLVFLVSPVDYPLCTLVPCGIVFSVDLGFCL